jgi:hypothetical protein
MARSDRQDLASFISNVEVLIRAVIFASGSEAGLRRASRVHWSGLTTAFRDIRRPRDEGSLLLTSNLNEMAIDAWGSWSQRNVGIEEILGLDAITTATVMDNSFEQRGLFGSELQFKLAGFHERPQVPTYESSARVFRDIQAFYAPLGEEDRSIAAFGELISPPVSNRFSFFRWRFRSWLVGTLDWADVTLDSLVSAVPMIEPLKEIKQAVVAGLKDPSNSE